VDWRRKLAGLVRQALAATAGASDWTWRKPGRRSLHAAGRAGWPLAPAYHQPTPTVGIVLDTSGSMQSGAGDGRTVLDEALSEVVGIARAAGASCWAVACDAQAYDVVRVAGPADIGKLNRGGGGTMMRPGFLKVRDAKHPDLVVIVTDGLVGGDWPTALDCGKTRCIAAVVGGGPAAPDWIKTVEVA
jgi:predicted metal-dependent peptidase